MNGIPVIDARMPVVGYESFVMMGHDSEARVWCPAQGEMGSLTTATRTAGFYVQAFCLPFDCMISKIVNPLGTGASIGWQYGIYSNKSDNVLYPEQVIWSSQVFSSVPAHISNLSIAIRGGQCYWVALSFDTNTTNCIVINSGSSNTGCVPWLGHNGSFGEMNRALFSTGGAFGITPAAPSNLTVSNSTNPFAFAFLLEP